MYGLLVMMIFLSYGYMFLKTKNQRKIDAMVLTEWNYEEEDLVAWKQSFSKVEKKASNKTKITPKIVFTPTYVYVTKRKKLSVKKEKFSNLILKQVEIESDFLVLHYYFSDMLKVKSFYIYIPKKMKRKDVVSLQKKIKDLI